VIWAAAPVRAPSRCRGMLFERAGKRTGSARQRVCACVIWWRLDSHHALAFALLARAAAQQHAGGDDSEDSTDARQPAADKESEAREDARDHSSDGSALCGVRGGAELGIVAHCGGS
jgi:hypothetical protein